ncbi:hypothetical protein DFJ74DRAFT_766304 [Hyaloraphidium curvatum]|nr:hypothetical protein DFJ74DRAFT_766304 [Hyaloraphidium curvatum]
MDFARHPAAWRGRELAKDHSWEYRFGAAELSELHAAALALVSRTPSPNLAHLRPSDAPLPLLEPRLAEWRSTLLSGRGFVLLRGVPVDSWPRKVVESAYLALGAHLGSFVPQNSNGDLLGHVKDDGSDPNDPTVRRYRTREPQPYHVDGSDAVGLLCLVPAKSGGKSSIVSSVEIYNEVARKRPDLMDLLRVPYYFDSYGQNAPGTDPWFTTPLFVGTKDAFRFFYVRWYIDKAQGNPRVPRLSKKQVELLDLIDALAASDELRLDMDFAPGDIQLVSNRVVLHAREGYEDWEEPERKRHLLRLWLAMDDKNAAPESFDDVIPGAPEPTKSKIHQLCIRDPTDEYVERPTQQNNDAPDDKSASGDNDGAFDDEAFDDEAFDDESINQDAGSLNSDGQVEAGPGAVAPRRSQRLSSVTVRYNFDEGEDFEDD